MIRYKTRTSFLTLAFTLLFYTCAIANHTAPTNPICQLNTPKPFQKAMYEWLQSGLNIPNFKSWVFTPGTLFNAKDIWWHSKNGFKRQVPHEGTDFIFFLNTKKNQIQRVSPGTKIPLIYPGKLIAIFKDFIGYSALFETNIHYKNWRFYVLYTHIKPNRDLQKNIGSHFKKNIELFSYNMQIKNYAPPHLHLSTFWAKKGFPIKNLSWEKLNSLPNVRYTNPLAFEKLFQNTPQTNDCKTP